MIELLAFGLVCLVLINFRVFILALAVYALATGIEELFLLAIFLYLICDE